MKKNYLLAITLLAALLTVLVCPSFQAKATKGPRSDVDVLFYENQASAYAALKIGEVDFIQGSLTYEQRLNAEDDPDLCVAAYSENGMMEFDLNNNYTIQAYPGVRNPLHMKEFRRALSCMVDKQYIINEILKGAGALLNVPITVNSISWWPTCALPENYEWTYNLTKAEEQLVAAGFVDTDDDGIRNYPVGWPGRETGPNMDPLIMYVRTEDKRLDVGRYLASQLDLFGIAYTKIEGSSDICYPPVMDERNYHIYTGGWNLGRYPTFLYWGYSGDHTWPGGSNYVTGMNSSNLPNYPDYDELARDMYYADSIESARTAAKAAAALGWCEYVFNIPLWSRKYFVGWRKTMPGVVNHAGIGLDNPYQFLNAYNTLDGPIRIGTVAAPEALNPLYSVWYYEYAVLDRVYEGLMMTNPYDLGIDQPGAAQDWEVGTWVDPDPGPGEPNEKTKVTYYLRKDVGCIAPNGTFMRNLNAYDLEFSCWYTYAFNDGWIWDYYSDIHHTRVVDDYTIEFYFDEADYWFSTRPQYPIFPKTELIDTLCSTTSTTITVAANVTTGTTYWLDCDPIVTVTSDDIPVDYKMVAGYETHTHTYTHTGISFDAVPADGTYTINYYTPSLDPHGYYLAGLDWTETWYGFGPFYPTEIIPGVGGHASLNKNPYYWMETPPLGETDWRWIWETPGGIPGPSNPGRDGGHYKIEIYDVVKATTSYCHCGDGPYDPQYFPGADLDASDLGHVGIYDLTTITGKYGQIWGTPPGT
jgi:ABC-type transport system substrate-binding protein